MSTVISDEQALRNISANIRRLLVDRGWTQLDLAERTGESSATLSRLTRGYHMPGAGLLARIAEAFDVSVDRLVNPPPKKIVTNAETEVDVSL